MTSVFRFTKAVSGLLMTALALSGCGGVSDRRAFWSVAAASKGADSAGAVTMAVLPMAQLVITLGSRCTISEQTLQTLAGETWPLSLHPMLSRGRGPEDNGCALKSPDGNEGFTVTWTEPQSPGQLSQLILESRRAAEDDKEKGTELDLVDRADWGPDPDGPAGFYTSTLNGRLLTASLACQGREVDILFLHDDSRSAGVAVLNRVVSAVLAG